VTVVRISPNGEMRARNDHREWLSRIRQGPLLSTTTNERATATRNRASDSHEKQTERRDEQ